MPHLRVRGLSAQQVQKLTSGLSSELAQALATQPDNFTFEYVATEFFAEGTSSMGWPFVEVLMFERPAEQKQACARVLSDRIRALSSAMDVTVIFQILDKANYFENGQQS